MTYMIVMLRKGQAPLTVQDGLSYTRAVWMTNRLNYVRITTRVRFTWEQSV